MSRFYLDITDSQIALIAGGSIIQSPGAALSNGSAVKRHSNLESLYSKHLNADRSRPEPTSGLSCRLRPSMPSLLEHDTALT